MFQKGLYNFEMTQLQKTVRDRNLKQVDVERTGLQFFIYRFAEIILRLYIRGHYRQRAVSFKYSLKVCFLNLGQITSQLFRYGQFS